jgi:murein L,D-transpeptidase YafK
MKIRVRMRWMRQKKFIYMPLLLLLIASAGAATTAQQADRVVVLKSRRILELKHGNTVLKTYGIALGSVPVGPKERQGDHKTPEGTYVIDSKNEHSHYHLALHVSYPSPGDRERARKMGVSPGGDIMIHGLPAGYSWLGAAHRRIDWTDGCIAVTNKEIEEIWGLVKIGTVVEIKP